MPIRRPTVAGMFYEGSPAALRAQVEECFTGRLGPGRPPAMDPAGPRALVGLVAPHAGLMYSGYAAAHAYARLGDDGPVDVAVILGPNHRDPYAADTAVWPAGAWETPLGRVPVAAEVAAALCAACPFLDEDPRAHADEHSIEVQLPFLQVLYGVNVSIVPISMKRYVLGQCVALGEAIAGALQGRNGVVIASSDFSHYETAERARAQDAAALEAIERLDLQLLFERVHDMGITTCGYGPVAVMLAAASAMGARQAEVLTYHTSGDVSGDNRRVVGYAAVAAHRGISAPGGV